MSFLDVLFVFLLVFGFGNPAVLFAAWLTAKAIRAVIKALVFTKVLS